MFTFKVDGVTVHTVENKKAKEFKAVKIFAADPWYESTNGKIKNLKVVNGGRASSKGFEIRKKSFFQFFFVS